MIDGTLSGLLQAARFTVQDPRAGARAIMAMGLPMGARWLALAFAAIGSTLLTVVAVRLSPMGSEPAVAEVLSRPIPLAVMQAVVLVVAINLIHWIGRSGGGRGSFADALVLMVWLQVILMLLQVAQLLLELVFPPAAEVLGLVGLALFLWLLTNFVAELHGFKSLGRVFAGIIGTVFGLSFALALVLMSFVEG